MSIMSNRRKVLTKGSGIAVEDLEVILHLYKGHITALFQIHMGMKLDWGPLGDITI